MKKFLLIAFLVAFVTCPLIAQKDSTVASQPSVSQPPTTQQVMKFFEVMHVHDQMQTLLQTEQKQVKIMVDDMFNKRLPDATPEQRAQFQSMMNDIMSEMFTNYPIDDLLRDMVPIYQSHLSESDLNAILAFYASPVGQKVLREMPAMTAEAMRVSYTRLQPKIEEMVKKMEARVQKMATDEKQTVPSKTNDTSPDSSNPKN